MDTTADDANRRALACDIYGRAHPAADMAEPRNRALAFDSLAADIQAKAKAAPDDTARRMRRAMRALRGSADGIRCAIAQERAETLRAEADRAELEAREWARRSAAHVTRAREYSAEIEADGS